jgi:Rod binding domain-containing protein
MNELSNNMDFNALNSLLGSKTEELSRIGVRSKETKLTEQERSKFAKVSRGFEAMFVNMLMKEMKTSLQDDENPEFSGPLSEYTDTLFSEQVSNQGTGIGIAEKVYKFLTGEELESTKIIQAAEPAQKTAKTNLIQDNTIAKIAEVSKASETPNIGKGNFLEKVKNRIDAYDEIIARASKKFNIPQELIKAVITTESAGHANAKSKVGAKGLMQLMDGTARDMGVTDSFDPAQNIFGGTYYLRKMIDKFGSLDLAIAAYNAGPGNVEKYGGIPPFNETKSYVKKVNKYLDIFQNDNSSNRGIKS